LKIYLVNNFRIIFISLFLSILFSEDMLTSWIQEHSFNDTILFIDVECELETTLLLNNFENSSKKYIHLQMDHNNKFKFEMYELILVANNETWKRFDSRTNQLFIQNPDSNFINIIDNWKSILLSNELQFIKKNGKFELINTGSLQSVSFEFDTLKNTISQIKIANSDTEYLITNLNFITNSEIPKDFNEITIENTFIFDLRE